MLVRLRPNLIKPASVCFLRVSRWIPSKAAVSVAEYLPFSGTSGQVFTIPYYILRVSFPNIIYSHRRKVEFICSNYHRIRNGIFLTVVVESREDDFISL